MKKRKIYNRLGRKQLAFFRDMFENNLTEEQAIAKNKIEQWRFRKWLENSLFVAEFEKRVDSALRESRMRIAHSAPKAADRLVELISCEKEETARRTCLDVLTLPVTSLVKQNEDQQEKLPGGITLSDAKAEKLLAVLAEDE